VDFINPIQPIKNYNAGITKNMPTLSEMPKRKGNPNKTRSKRSDATHSIKFPVDPIQQMKLKTYCRQAKRIYQLKGREPLSQTKFNNMLVRFGLKHLYLAKWSEEYKDSGVYMHTNLLETEYVDIGGPHGLAVRKNLSERKVIFFIIASVLSWLEGGEGSLEKII
jgi:hypothetical protein